jgi:hypothetical protein
MLLGDAHHSRRYESKQAYENKGDKRHNNQVGQFAADELLRVADPLIEHLAQEPAFRKQAWSCR